MELVYLADCGPLRAGKRITRKEMVIEDGELYQHLQIWIAHPSIERFHVDAYGCPIILHTNNPKHLRRWPDAAVVVTHSAKVRARTTIPTVSQENGVFWAIRTALHSMTT